MVGLGVGILLVILALFSCVVIIMGTGIISAGYLYYLEKKFEKS
jgi:hypothetical protein